MIITGKRKRKIDKRLGFLIEGKKVNIGVPVNEDNIEQGTAGCVKSRLFGKI